MSKIEFCGGGPLDGEVFEVSDKADEYQIPVKPTVAMLASIQSIGVLPPDELFQVYERTTHNFRCRVYERDTPEGEGGKVVNRMHYAGERAA